MGLEKPLTVDSQYDVDKQVSDVETMVNDEYDAIMISPIDQNALTDVVTKANDAGIVTSCAAQSVDIVGFPLYRRRIQLWPGNWTECCKLD